MFRTSRTALARVAAAALLLPAAATGGAAAQSAVPAAALAPPKARIAAKVDTLHGEVRVDDYFWLREKESPEVRAHLEAENAYTAAGMRHTAALQERLYEEILGRVKETDHAVPYRDGAWWYSTRTEKGKSYPIFVRRRGSPKGREEVILDQNALAEGKTFHALGGFDPSPDGGLLVYLEDTTAFRDYTLYVKDLRTGRLVDSITSGPGRTVWNGTAWAGDGRTFFYMTADSAKRGNAVWRHVVGTPPAQDVKVFQEDDVLNNVGVFRSRSGKYVFIAADGFTSSEWRVIPAAEPAAAPRVIAPRRAGVEYAVDHGEDGFYVLTNDGARNFRVVLAPEATPGPEHWTDWLPHRDSVFVEGIDVFRGHVVVSERARGLRRLRVTDLARRLTHYVDFPEAAYGVFPTQNVAYDTRSFRFTYSSLVTPSSVYDYDLATRRRVLRKRQEIPSGYDASRYEVHRIAATARDGTPVPVSILARRGTARDGRSPLLLYAYGSYGATVEPTFNSSVLSLVERGFVYAIAHVRGGQEMGRQWYDDGKMMKKMNTFTDFIDVGEALVREGWTAPERLVANGGSAGGLLMGAVANMRPDLFRAIVADVPFVDVINTMLDASLPLTAQEWEQWGNPTNPEHYAYMRQYSPYDNVEAKGYPWLLVTTSFNDSQVMYWEPAKWVARLRARKTDASPLYFRTNMGGGHGGSSGRYERMRETAFRYAFMLDAVGLAPRPTP
jgi:oligopeptidase B